MKPNHSLLPAASLMVLTGLLTLARPMLAGDVQGFTLTKGATLTQFSAAAPMELTAEYAFYSSLRLAGAEAITEATVLPPGSDTPESYGAGDDPLLWDVERTASSLEELDATYPSGSYAIAIQAANDGAKEFSLNLPSGTLPGAPTITSYTALQGMDPGKAFDVTWSAFSGATANDYIGVTVLDLMDSSIVWATPDPGATGALAGTVTKATIPANTLKTNEMHMIFVLFMKVASKDTTSYPGATGVIGFYKQTQALFTTGESTAGPDTTPPTLSASDPSNGGTEVPVDKTIKFTFNEAMQNTLAAVSINWTGVSAAKFSYDWSADAKTLSCTYSEDLPSNTLIGWSLNPTAPLSLFKDKAGNKLATTSGSFTTETVGGQDTTPPVLLASQPLNLATGVSVHSPVVFSFSEPMDPAISIEWIGLSGNKFQTSWSGDAKTLTCTYMEDLPSKTQITWKLNPTTVLSLFKDVAGNKLPTGVFTGSFTTEQTGVVDPCNPEPDYSHGVIGVGKYLTYEQTAPQTVVPAAEEPAMFYASIVNPTNNPITAATLQVPGGATLTYSNMPFSTAMYAYGDYASKAALDANRPFGLYKLNATRQNGATLSPNIDTTTLAWPPTPEILNYTEAQSIDETADFLLRWNGIPNQGQNQTVSVGITGLPSFSWIAPDECKKHYLTNNNTAVLIPANTLGKATTYNVTLTFMSMGAMDTNSVPDFSVMAQATVSLHLTIKTKGGTPTTGPKFTKFELQPNNTLLLEIQGEPLTVWRLERANDLGGWSLEALVTILPSGTATQSVPLSGSRGFFRLVNN